VTADNLTVKDTASIWGALNVGKPAGAVPSNGLNFAHTYSSSATPAPDDSGNGGTGTVYGATWTANGATGGAYRFDGVDDYIQAPDSAWVNPTTGLTVNAWINRNDSGANQCILSKYMDGTTRDYELHFENDASFYVQVSVGNNHIGLDSGYVPPTGSWHMVSMVYDGNTLSTYVDGTGCSSTWIGGPLDDSNEPLTIGALTCAGSRSMFFNGLIDNVRIYGRALSAAELLDLYCAESTHNTTATLNASSVVASNLTVQGATWIKRQGDLSMGSFTNGPCQ
jgi:hypothetical protein